MNISVIIPVYNAQKYIEKAVTSVLQFKEVQEVLLIDDGSADHSLKICASLAQKHPQIKVLTHPDNQNRGVSASRNVGIDNASQDYIAFLDADDYWLPNRFDAEREIFHDPKVDGVFGGIDADFLGEQGKNAYENKFGTNTLCTVQYESEGHKIFGDLIEEPNKFGTFFSLIALTVKKEALNRHMLRINEDLTLMEDKEFIIRLAYHCYLKTGIIKEGVAIRTAHDSNSITRLQNNSAEYFHHNMKLYDSLYRWSRRQNVPVSYRTFFKLKYLSSKTASESGPKKFINFARYAVANPQLLKTRYRYFALKNNKE